MGLNELLEKIGEAIHPCPLCAKDMHPIPVRNALSRYTDRYICSDCGTVEALLLSQLNANPDARTCLYFDDIMGIGLVDETAHGYIPVWPNALRNESDWVKSYVQAVNLRHGITDIDQTTIVARSMFGPMV